MSRKGYIAFCYAECIFQEVIVTWTFPGVYYSCLAPAMSHLANGGVNITCSNSVFVQQNLSSLDSKFMLNL